jgi:hypothetical protein
MQGVLLAQFRINFILEITSALPLNKPSPALLWGSFLRSRQHSLEHAFTSFAMVFGVFVCACTVPAISAGVLPSALRGRIPGWWQSSWLAWHGFTPSLLQQNPWGQSLGILLNHACCIFSGSGCVIPYHLPPQP